MMNIAESIFYTCNKKYIHIHAAVSKASMELIVFHHPGTQMDTCSYIYVSG